MLSNSNIDKKNHQMAKRIPLASKRYGRTDKVNYRVASLLITLTIVGSKETFDLFRNKIKQIIVICKCSWERTFMLIKNWLLAAK